MLTSSSSTETIGLPINQSIAFSNHKGVFKERLKKQQFKTVQTFVQPLRR